MKKRVFALAAAFVCGVFAAGSVFAAGITECNVSPADNSVEINGSFENGGNVLLTVIKLDGESERPEENITYQWSQDCGDDNSFSFVIHMNGTGFYKAVAANGIESYSHSFVYSDKDTASDIFERINNAASAAEISSILSANRSAAGLYAEDCDAEPDYAAIARSAYESRPFDLNDLSASVRKLQSIMIYSYINNGDIKNGFIYDDVLKLSDIEGFDAFDESFFKDSHRQYATSLLKGVNALTPNEFNSKIAEASLLAVVRDPDGYGNIEKVLKTFANEAGIDASRITADVCKGLSGKTYKSYSDLRSAVDTLFNNSRKSNGSSSGGGSGGGGGGGGATYAGGKGGAVPYENEQSKSVPVETRSAYESDFADMDDYKWAVKAVNELAQKNIVSGREDGGFYPGDNITRAEFVKLIVAAFELPDGNKPIGFLDVSTASWEYRYVKAAFEAGIISGMSDTYFGAAENITREDMALILQRVTAKEASGFTEKFTDDDSIAPYAYEAVYTMKSNQIMQGDENGCFNPKQNALRAEAAQVIYNALEKR